MFKKIAILFLVLVMVSFLGGVAYSQKAKQPISEEQLMLRLLNFQEGYGAELVRTAKLGRTIIGYENQIRALQEEIKNLNAKIVELSPKPKDENKE
ncbi:hypothetical protein LCGC14_1247440 [marine sediment metagenome]|uniref:YbgF trimerisation domain-containing protein n=1 Tax=marine sediment metagenome TaxID=412755 RepID=A0A0F9L7R7_9ZZZZ